VSALDYLVATGTHQPMEMEKILRHVGITPEEYKTKYSKIRFYNHSYNDPAQLNTIGSLTGSEMSELSNGLFTDRWVSQSISPFSSSINCF